MSQVERAERAVLQQLESAPETLPKTIIERLQPEAEFTDALLMEAIWRLVAQRRVQFTRSLALSLSGETRSAAEPART